MGSAAAASSFPPAGMEIRLIERFVNLTDSNVVEVGCGDGRLTVQYAAQASNVVAIDPDPASIARGRRKAADQGISNVSFRVGSGERFQSPGSDFEVALFSWSL